MDVRNFCWIMIPGFTLYPHQHALLLHPTSLLMDVHRDTFELALNTVHLTYHLFALPAFKSSTAVTLLSIWLCLQQYILWRPPVR